MFRMATIYAAILLFVLGSQTPGADVVAPDASTVPFAERHSQRALEQAARDLFALTWIGEWGPRDFKRPGRWEQLGKVRASLDGKDYAAALEEFKRYSIEKLRLCDGENGFGVSTARMDPWSIGEPRWKWLHQAPVSDAQRTEIVRKADDLLNGVAIGGKNVDGHISGATAATIGKPGSIDWHAASAAASRHGNEDWPWRVEAFHPLLGAYLLTGDRKYIDSWTAYADDWALNQHEGLSEVAIDMEDRWGNAWGAFDLFRYFRGISMIPGGIDAIPADTFARVITRVVREYLPLAVFYQRANMTNWTDVGVPQMIDLAFLFDEYRCAPILFRDAMRDLELLDPLRHMPDGVDFDITYGYWRQYWYGAQGAIDRIGARGAIPDWLTPPWEQVWRSSFDQDRWCSALRDAMRMRGRFGVAHVTPDGETPIGGARVGHRLEAGIVKSCLELVPEMLLDPGSAQLLAFHAKGIAPAFTSECFPVTGLFYQRAGWSRGDPYLFMHCPPHLNQGSMGTRNANAIGIAAYGADLLETGDNGPYDSPHSPLRVDGREANFSTGLLPWGHRGVMGGGETGASAWQDAPAWRWHDSPRFDLAEGKYSGGYGDKDHITGVTHTRQAFFVRRAGMWIVVDRLGADAKHTCTLDWRFPIAPGKDVVFTLDQIVADQEQQQISTRREGGPNITLRQFSANRLTFDRAEERTDPKNGYRTHDFVRIGASWQASGPSVVVTAILPRQKIGNDLTAVRDLSTADATGFEAVAPTGAKVRFQAARGTTAKLTLGDASADAEALLIVEEPSQERSGIVLGAKDAVVVDGHRQALSTADAEFGSNNGQVVSTAIHTPVANVAIEPADRNAFVGSQDITLACPTPDMDIHYTIDGIDPTLLSAPYHAPFSITRDTTIKARAFRKGVTQMPVTMSCREASLVTRADFTVLTARPAVEVSTVPGLHYEISKGRWQDLFLNPRTVPATSSGDVDSLFASASMIPGDIYRVSYQGYLAVPSEGVYTFQAPPESYMMNVVSGYDLEIFVDGIEWYPATSVHALGAWSIALKPGKHRFEVSFGDFRGDAPARCNKQGYAPWIWTGGAPDVKVSGPGIKTGAIPLAWFCR